MKWEVGRQGGGYKKKLLWSTNNKLFGIDCYIIKFTPNYHLKPHKDEVESGKHYRLNLEVKGEGKFFCKEPIFKLGKLVVFRPDKVHSMINGNSERTLFSIGLNIKK